ncbi:uncharacterized protein C6orf136 homolog [Myripristis murdjan]|uniref:Si:ch211-215a10.4 n=1 Tax=Myripristis murdjan TaxID=586833 RepID=A0A667WT59_9TELE|nr:uncharacterized protein C6orf136 homolog [Myripristis murdjan]XP_029918889.1 uncharacterized protein C6orf136 homolog [Myripristis murdjan]XP_029918890.1 uncharacterized protein C6orf136 homolog [Myripristis murdjan]
MAVSRGGIAFWVGCVRSHGRRQPIKQHWTVSQTADWQCIGHTRPLSSASWALAPPNSLRYQNVKQPVLSHPFHHASQPQRAGCFEEEWEDSVSVCVLVRPGESCGQHTLVEIPLFGQTKTGEHLAPGVNKSMEFLFPLTTVDGSREDDISVEMKPHSLKGNSADAGKREHGCFRSLFEAEGCPAPFMYGSRFYCFHCPGTEPVSGFGVKDRHGIGLENKPLEMSLLLPVSLCSPAERAEGDHNGGESEGEEKLALIYERLRIELPSFFLKSHDYTMYSNDVEFVNGLINTKTRGRLVYQLTLSLWRLLCFCYYVEARLEVLKLTKHMEDGTIKARWRIRGLPFHTLLLRFYRKDKSHLYRSYDAFSTFYIGHDGLIHCHKVEKVMQAQPPVLPRVTSLLAGALVALGVQEHRPALNLLPLLLSSLRQGRN